MDHKELAPDVKLIDEYRVDVGGRYVRVIEQFRVLEFDRSGNIWLSLSILDVSPNRGTEGGVRSQLLNYRTGEVFPLPTPEASSLSGREREILRLISRGKLSKEIADQLNISVHTVNTHRQHILEKLNADNSMEAVRYASARGLLARYGQNESDGRPLSAGLQTGKHLFASRTPAASCPENRLGSTKKSRYLSIIVLTKKA